MFPESTETRRYMRLLDYYTDLGAYLFVELPCSAGETDALKNIRGTMGMDRTRVKNRDIFDIFIS